MAFFLALLGILFNMVITTNRQMAENYILIVRISTLLDLSLAAILFYNIIETRLFKKISLVISSVMCLYLVFDLFASSDVKFDSVPSGFVSLTTLSYSILYLFERVKNTDALFFYTSPNFWVVAAVMVYAAGTLFPFIYARSYINKGEEFDNDFDFIHAVIYIIRNIILSVAMFTQDKTNQTKYPAKKKKPYTTSINPR